MNTPVSWNEITIKQQLEAERLAAENPDFKSLAVLAAYRGLSIDTLKKKPIQEVRELLKGLSWMADPLPNTPISEFEYKGKTYSVIPTLLKAETQDFLTITMHESSPDALLYIIAVMAKRKVNGVFESLNDFDIDERAKHFEDLPVTTAKALEVFFCRTGNLLTIDFQQVLKEQNTQLLESIRYTRTILRTRVGGGLFSVCVRVILRAYLWYLKLRWNKLYSSFNLEATEPN